MAVDIFSVPVFFVIFRETLETVIIVSVLLAFLKQTLGRPNRNANAYKKFVRQVWFGMALGLLLCLIIGGGLIGTFYTLGRNAWASTESYWEGAFAIFASAIITVLGAALLRVSRMQEKWRTKLTNSMEAKVGSVGSRMHAFKRFCEKYVLAIIPFITVLREGLEAVVFVAGVTFSAPATAVPLAVVCGFAAGGLVGYGIYKGGACSKLQYFLVVSTCLLYLVAAGLMSRGVWLFEIQEWNNAVGGESAETGPGPGSYDITKSVWHMNYGSPSLNGGGGWGLFNAVLGWQNSATYGSVLSYNMYWIVVIAGFLVMRFKEVKGHWPLVKAKQEPLVERQQAETQSRSSSDLVESGGVFEVKNGSRGAFAHS